MTGQALGSPNRPLINTTSLINANETCSMNTNADFSIYNSVLSIIEPNKIENSSLQTILWISFKWLT